MKNLSKYIHRKVTYIWKIEVILTVIWTIEAIVSDFNGIQTRDLCDVGATLYQLSYEATQLGAGQFIGLMYSHEKNVYLNTNLFFIFYLKYKGNWC